MAWGPKTTGEWIKDINRKVTRLDRRLAATLSGRSDTDGWITITDDVVMAPQWALATSRRISYRRDGRVVHIAAWGIEKTASPAMPVPIDGNVGNSVVMQLPTSLVPAAKGQPGEVGVFTTLGQGRAATYYLASDGRVVMSATTPLSTQTGSIDFPTGEQISFGGSYVLT